jgi:hypothetical protein
VSRGPRPGDDTSTARQRTCCAADHRRRPARRAGARDRPRYSRLVDLGTGVRIGPRPTARRDQGPARPPPAAHTDAFFAWIADEYERVKHQRGLLRTALGYAHRQRGPLTRSFDDGRLELTNNQSERELRRVATDRKAWLFVGSDDHGQASGNLLTLIASARLHRLDPEAYLRDLFRVLPHWPSGGFLELCPRY